VTERAGLRLRPYECSIIAQIVVDRSTKQRYGRLIGGNEASGKTKEKTVDKSKKYYWAVFQGRDPIFEGSFNDCWHHLMGNFCNETVKTLVKRGIRIGRLS
jgi:hypothetical protein